MAMRWKKLCLLLGSLMFVTGAMFASATSVMAAMPSWEGVGNQLVCQCGCNATLPNCTHGECMVRDEMLTIIKDRLAQGQSEKAIVQFFVGRYGEQVLASPPKRGFNLVAWILPFAAIMAAGLAIYVAIRVWVNRGSELKPSTTTRNEEEDQEYLKRVEKELKDYAERGFR